MGISVSRLVEHPQLDLRPLTNYAGVDVEWSHSTDLDDPTPFLEAGQMLLTTGRQFADYTEASQYRAYVDRLRSSGVVAIGFGTEVVTSGTPVELIAACEGAGMALVEVPYATPFIAVSKFIADEIAAEARRQLEWALAAEDAISKAVLGSGGLAAAVRTASEALDAGVGVLDAGGELLEGAAPAPLRNRALDLLARGRRGRDEGSDETGSWMAQTLGRSGRLLGAVVVRRSSALSASEASVVTMLTALTELSLEHAEDQRLGFRPIARQLFRLLREGRRTAVEEALVQHPVRLPRAPFSVVAVRSPELPAATRDALERMAASRGHRLFAVEEGERFFLLADDSSRPGIESRLTGAGVRVGVSNEVGWEQLDDAVSQSVTALEAAADATIQTFSDLASTSVFGLLAESHVAAMARVRLAPLLGSPTGTERLRDACVWLRHNGAWDPAARELGLHRHTLKQRISELGDALALPLDDFGARAELWALLAAVDLAGAAGPR
jgi:purine catabolism regulator